MNLWNILGIFSKFQRIKNGRLFGNGFASAMRAETQKSANMENMLAAAAEKTARENLAGDAAKLRAENYDFSTFSQNWRAENFTNRDLFLANLRNFSTAELDDDNFMNSPANFGFLSENNLQLLAFSLKNKDVSFNAKDKKLSFSGGAIEIDYLEISANNVLNFISESQMGILDGANFTANESEKVAGFVRARAKLLKNVPEMIVNPARGVSLSTADLAAQKIETEGGENSHFKIFVSPNYQIDALYIFTPDVLNEMATFGANFAYKLFDNELEIYAPSFALKKPEMVRALVFLTINLAQAIEKQSANYRDERANSFAQKNGNLAPRGRRMALKTGLGIAGGIAILFFILNYVLPFVIAFFW